MSDVGTLKEYLPLVRFGDSGEKIKHRCFAQAVWTNHAQRFPLVEMRAQIVDASSAPNRLQTPLCLRIALIFG
jgi:hypothetical protein